MEIFFLLTVMTLSSVLLDTDLNVRGIDKYYIYQYGVKGLALFTLIYSFIQTMVKLMLFLEHIPNISF